MKRKRYSEEQIIKILKDGEAGVKVADEASRTNQRAVVDGFSFGLSF